MKNSISGKLVLVLTLCVALITGLSMLVDYRLSRQDILQRVHMETRDTINSVLTDMENWLDAVEGATLFLARILQHQNYQPAQLEQMLKDIVANNEDIFGATIALNPALTENSRGFAPYYFHRDDGIAYADLTRGEDNYWQRNWYSGAVAAGQALWVEPYFDRDGGEVLMTTFSVPVYRTSEQGAGELYAVVTADITLEELQNYLQRLRLGDSGFGILLSRKGTILSAGDSSLAMRHYLDTAEGERNRQAWQDLVSTALLGKHGQEQLKCPDIPGQCIVHMGSLDSTGWPVGVMHSEDEMLAPLHEFRIKLGLVSLVTLLLLALAVYLVTRSITRPLGALAKASDQLARGELDMPLPVARGGDEVAVLVASFATMRQELKQYIADLEAVTASRSRLEGEMAAARDIQMSMLPQGGEALEHNSDYSLWARVRPAKSVGGDLYTYYQADGYLYLAVGDVSDKGVPAALFMAKAISIIQQMADSLTDPGAAMAHLNNSLEEGNDNCMFVTLFLGALNLSTGELYYASGGHTPPALLRDNSVRPIDQVSGPALGLATGQEFPTNHLQLEPGDRLALWTDGIDEAFNTQNQMFGTDRLLSCLAEQQAQALDIAGNSIIQTVDEFSLGVGQSDDITLLLLDLSQKDTTLTSPELHSRAFTRESGLVSRVIDWLDSVLRRASPSVDITREVQLVAEELVTNIDKYAQLRADDEIELEIGLTETHLSLQVSDTGLAFNPLLESKQSPLGEDIDSATIGGLGVHLIVQLTDQQSYHRTEGRNILRVVKLLSD